MIKKDIFAGDSRARIEAGARDRLYSFILEGVNVRGAILHGTTLVREMRANHGLDQLASMLLGHAYLAAGLLSSSLKGDDRLGLKVECDGPVRGLSVESTAFGEVRGRLFQPLPEIHVPFDMSDLSPLWGAGSLSLVRWPESGREPFTGRVELIGGSLARNLANCFLVSEQIPTAFNLSVRFDRTGEVRGAGGLFLQALPGAADEVLEDLEHGLAGLPSIGAAFADGMHAEELLAESFGRYFPRVLESRRVEFYCRCSAERFRSIISGLGRQELDDMLAQGPFPVITTCHNCNSSYEMTREELLALRERSYGPRAG
jgi:molecular chaperone Hsp33